MSARNNFIKTPLSISNISCSFVYLGFFIITCLSSFSLSQDCSFINECKCRFPNGSIIDISSLGNHDHSPKWLDMKPVRNDSFKYSYNACNKFNLGSKSVCQNVAICQRDDKGEEYNCGKDAHFMWNSARNALQIFYDGAGKGPDGRNTTVNLVCSPGAYTPQLVVEGEVSKQHYEMTLTSRCACSDLCRESHLSTGSVLVILFMIFVALYLVLGIIHSSLTRGAHGWELIPHYEFWADFPLLVRDGCVFVVSGCKADTAYERI